MIGFAKRFPVTFILMVVNTLYLGVLITREILK